MSKIKLTGVTKSFGSKHVLNGVDLDVPEGKSVVIIGGSGTGKSVLLKNVLGLMRPDHGKIFVDGEDTTYLTGKKRDRVMQKFGMLFQGGALFDSLPVWRNVTFGLAQRQRLSTKDAREITAETLGKVGLKADIMDQLPSELSGGMQKRVGLARAIASKPEVLFFDEPTTGLDPIMADVINNLIVSSVRELGATALTITHDMASVRKIADYVAMLYEGKVIWYGAVNEMDHSDNAYVLQFVNGLSKGPIKF